MHPCLRLETLQNQWFLSLISISVKVRVNHELAKEHKYIQFCIEIPEVRIICYPGVAGETPRQDRVTGEELLRVLHKPASTSNKTKTLICKWNCSHPHPSQRNGRTDHRYLQRCSPTSSGVWNVALASLQRLIHWLS